MCEVIWKNVFTGWLTLFQQLLCDLLSLFSLL